MSSTTRKPIWITLAVIVLLVAILAAWALGRRAGGNTSPAPTPTATPSAPTESATLNIQAEIDAIAAEAMPAVTDNLPESEAAATTQPLVLPTPTSTDSNGVLTGFPRTPEGALAQLKAIDEAAATNMSAATARGVYESNFEPGHPEFYEDGWAISGNINQFLRANPSRGDGDAKASFTVTQGLIKGTTSDGNYVVPCVLGVLEYSAGGAPTRIGGTECMRMRWTGKRWMAQPLNTATPPYPWPHSAKAYSLGFRDLKQGA